MKFEFTSLETEPLVYFLLHSTVFVAVAGLIFFLLGFCFGALTWGRYKKKNRLLLDEMNTLREEGAVLKRKLAEQVIRPGTGPLGAPAPALLTEVLPKPSEIFPETATTSPAPASPPLPLNSAAPAVIKPVAIPLSAPESPSGHEVVVLPLIPELASIPGVSHPTPEQVAALFHPVEPQAAPAPERKRTTRELPEPSDIEPFSFLLPDTPPEDFVGSAVESSEPQAFEGFMTVSEEPLDSTSPLAAIAAAESPAVTLEPVAPPTVTILPETDAALGLVYRQPPPLVDDLTRVNGISPALQKRLQELGIYRFQQIADWKPAHIREFSRRLTFKDRIERERWVDQARRLMDGGPLVTSSD